MTAIIANVEKKKYKIMPRSKRDSFSHSRSKALDLIPESIIIDIYDSEVLCFVSDTKHDLSGCNNVSNKPV